MTNSRPYSRWTGEWLPVVGVVLAVLLGACGASEEAEHAQAWVDDHPLAHGEVEEVDGETSLRHGVDGARPVVTLRTTVDEPTPDRIEVTVTQVCRYEPADDQVLVVPLLRAGKMQDWVVECAPGEIERFVALWEALEEVDLVEQVRINPPTGQFSVALGEFADGDAAGVLGRAISDVGAAALAWTDRDRQSVIDDHFNRRSVLAVYELSDEVEVTVSISESHEQYPGEVDVALLARVALAVDATEPDGSVRVHGGPEIFVIADASGDVPRLQAALDRDVPGWGGQVEQTADTNGSTGP